jgi:hypothetical protein
MKYISRIGEIKTKEEWLDWFDKAILETGYDQVFKSRPTNPWNRIIKLLELLPC